MSPMKPRQPMPEQSPEARAKNFKEVALGYDAETAQTEASRCLQCKARPCVSGCPVGVDIPEFIHQIKEGDFPEAIRILKGKNSLPAICGRVCPQENQCEKFCVMGKKFEPVAIGRLERFAADQAVKEGSDHPVEVAKNGHRVAVIGSGPAGLSASGDLAKMGYQVTIFEALHATGGVLRYGIPEFRLPKKILEREVEYVKALGVEIKTDMVIGKVLTLKDLFDMGYEAIFISSGAGAPAFMNIPGENLNGVYSANEFLTRINLMRAYQFPTYDTPVYVGKRAAVIGGGNTAMDSARTALRLGAEVTVVYRRSEAELPARKEEYHHAQDEGISFKLLTNPIQILGDDKGWVKGMECIRMELGEPDASGRRRPVPIEDSEFVLDVDMVIVAIGTKANPIIAKATPDLEINKRGNIVADKESCETNLPGVFAGGDIVSGSATVIEAMGAGKRAAKSIDEYIQSKK